MDLRNIFKEVSEQLLSEFRKTRNVQHDGGKGTLREDAFATFLRDHLPSRYAVGRGEIVSSDNDTSAQIDVVLHDPTHCPALIRSSAHAVFPIESVYAALCIKSTLSSTQLEEAYENIASVKRLVSREGFTLRGHGIETGMYPPILVGGVVAYQADRSLEAIAEQMRTLNAGSQDQNLRPDFVAVLGEGIVGPRMVLRGEFNAFSWPNDAAELTRVRATKRHTLLRLFLQLVRELNALHLRDLDLGAYLRMPAVLDGHKVRRHDRFVRWSEETNDRVVRRLTAKAIKKIVEHCSKVGPVDSKTHLMNSVGTIPIGMQPDELTLPIFEYNPNGLPPMDPATLTKDAHGRPTFTKAWFHATPIEIDGKNYAVDISALGAKDFEDHPDVDFDELFAE